MDKLYTLSIEESVKSAFHQADDEMITSGNWDKMHQLLNQELPLSSDESDFSSF